MSRYQRLTISVDIADQPDNNKLAIDTLTTIVRHLEYDAIYPLAIRLQLQPIYPHTTTLPIESPPTH